MRFSRSLIFVSLLFVSTASWASETNKSSSKSAAAKLGAKSLLDQGNTEFANKNYKQALQLYQAAYALFSSPKISYNIAQAAEQLGQNLLALRNYEQVLSAHTNRSLPEAVIAETKAGLKRLEEKLATVIMAGRPLEATIKVDGESRGQLDGSPIRIRTGQRVISVEHPGYLTHQESIEAKGKQKYEFEVHLKSILMPQADAKADEIVPVHQRVWFWSTLGAVVFLGAVGGIWAVNSGGAGVESEHGVSAWSDWELR